MRVRRMSRCFAIGLSLASSSLVTAAPNDIRVFLTCVAPIDATAQASQWYAYFGYESREPGFVAIPIGPDNRFIPSPSDRGQPALFAPGYHPTAFRAVFDPSMVLQWIFEGRIEFASRESVRCVDALRAPLHPALTVVSGAGQQATVGAPFAQPVVVRALANGLPVPGMLLRAAAPVDGPSAQFAPGGIAQVTDAAGEVRFAPIANAVAGRYRLRIFAGTLDAPRGTAVVDLANTP